jgi:hypothetical protein
MLTHGILQHVSAIFHRNATGRDKKTDHSKQMVLFDPDKSAFSPANDASTDIKPSLDGSSGLQGLSIINQGHLTLHYHSYNDASSSVPQRSTGRSKRALDRAEDEEYSEALASLMDFNLPPESRRNPPPSPKRPRLEEPDIEMMEHKVQEPQKRFKQEDEEEPVKHKTQKNNFICRNCGESYNPRQNKGYPCNYHPGMSSTTGRLVLQLSIFETTWTLDA